MTLAHMPYFRRPGHIYVTILVIQDSMQSSTENFAVLHE